MRAISSAGLVGGRFPASAAASAARAPAGRALSIPAVFASSVIREFLPVEERTATELPLGRLGARVLVKLSSGVPRSPLQHSNAREKIHAAIRRRPLHAIRRRPLHAIRRRPLHNAFARYLQASGKMKISGVPIGLTPRA